MRESHDYRSGLKCILSLIPLIAALSVHAAPIKSFGDRIFLGLSSPPRIEAYNATTRSWELSVQLGLAPTAIHADSNGLYVAYSKNVYRCNFDGSSLTQLRTLPADATTMFTDGNFLFVFYPDRLDLINRVTGATVASGTIGANVSDLGRGISHSAATNTFYGRSIYVYPSDIVKMQYDGSGNIYNPQGSPHHGDYPDASMTWIFPNRALVVDNAGIVYDQTTLRFITSLCTQIDAIDFPGNGGVDVVHGDTLIGFDSRLLEIGRTMLRDTVMAIKALQEDVLVFYADPNNVHGVTVEAVPRTNLLPLQPSQYVDPNGLPFSPDDAFVAFNTLYVRSNTHKNIFRWDIVTQQWSTSIPLLGEPLYTAVSEETKTIYTAYDNYKLFVIKTDAGAPVERPFANLAASCYGIVCAGDYLVSSDGTGAWESHTTFDTTGQRKGYRDWNYPLGPAVWNRVNSRVYHFRDGTSPNDLLSEQIGSDGAIISQMDSPYHGTIGIQYPIRVKPNGESVILGTGMIFNGTTLEQQNTLPEGLDDATWIGNELYTLRDSIVTHWLGITYAPGPTLVLPGKGYRLLTTNSNALLTIAVGNSGIPQIQLYDGSFNRIMPGVVHVKPSKRENGINHNSERWYDLRGRMVGTNKSGLYRNIFAKGCIIIGGAARDKPRAAVASSK